MITIAIVEDIKEIAHALQKAINNSAEMSCNQVYHNAEDAIHFIPQNPPNIVLADIGLPISDGIEAMIRIQETHPLVQFCMFTVFQDDEKIFDSLKAGAKGYLLKTTPFDNLLASLVELHNGGSPMSPGIARRVIEYFNENSNSKPQNAKLPLTSRENEILKLLANGFLYKEIAHDLKITLGTVKQHIHKIYKKLEVSNRTEAVNKLLR